MNTTKKMSFDAHFSRIQSRFFAHICTVNFFQNLQHLFTTIHSFFVHYFVFQNILQSLWRKNCLQTIWFVFIRFDLNFDEFAYIQATSEISIRRSHLQKFWIRFENVMFTEDTKLASQLNHQIICMVSKDCSTKEQLKKLW